MPPNKVGSNYTFVQDEAALAALVEVMRQAPIIALDYETTGFDWINDKIVGWAIAVREREAFYVPVRHTLGKQLEPATVAAAFKPILEDPGKIITIHNCKFDTRFMRREDVPIFNIDANTHDTLLETFVAAPWKETVPFDHFGLKELEERIWKVRSVAFEDLFDKRDKDKNIAKVPIPEAGHYAAADADYCLRLHNRYWDVVREPTTKAGSIYALEHQLWPIVRQIEETGVQLDVNFLQRQAEMIRQAASRVEQMVMAQASKSIGQPINFKISSPKQLAEVLYDLMKMPVRVRSKTGAPSTDELALGMLAEEYPICKNILTYRSMMSTIQTMGTKLPSSVSQDGRIHTSYNQAGATSGRFASSNPNLQNVAKVKSWVIQKPDGQEWIVATKPRDAFVAPDDYYLMEFDFAAIEYALMAAIAGEEGIVDAYNAGLDVHQETASVVLRKPFDMVTPAERRKAKTWNYLIIYGGGGYGLSMRSLQSKEDAEAEIARFFAARPGFRVWIQRTRDSYRAAKGYVSTFLGRRQAVPEYFDSSRGAQAKGDRACVNRIIQGSAADIHKIGIIQVSRAIAKHWSAEQVKLILQTHDSNTLQVHKSISPFDVAPIIQAAMSPNPKALPGKRLKLRVDVQIGVTWGTLTVLDEVAERMSKTGETWENIYEELRAEWVVKREALPTLMAEPMRLVENEVAEDEKARVREDAKRYRLETGLDYPTTPEARYENIHQLQIDPPPPALIKFWPGQPITAALSAQLIDLLDSFPGNNVVEVQQATKTSRMTKHPTALNEATLVEVLRQFMPNCRAEVDKAAMLAAVVGEL